MCVRAPAQAGVHGAAEGGALARDSPSATRRLNLKIVAEGVETEEQLRFLRGAGCDLVQGYLMSRAMPAHSFRELIGGAAAEPDHPAEAIGERDSAAAG